MPTTKPRHTITETDPVAEAIADAAVEWPDDAGNETKLVYHLIRAGHDHIRPRVAKKLEGRRTELQELAGSLSGVYGSHYLQELREDWPA